MAELSPFAVSVESELDRELEKFIAKIVDGTASVEDRRHFEKLSQQRIRMMQGGSVARYDYRQGRIRAAS